METDFNPNSDILLNGQLLTPLDEIHGRKRSRVGFTVIKNMSSFTAIRNQEYFHFNRR